MDVVSKCCLYGFGMDVVTQCCLDGVGMYLNVVYMVLGYSKSSFIFKGFEDVVSVVLFFPEWWFVMFICCACLLDVYS